MAFSRHRRSPKRHREPFIKHHETSRPIELQSTGSESAFLKSLVDSHAKVTVVLKNGERLRGHIRYYDRDCFSIGLSAKGPRFFLRKDSVCYIAEE